jgi:hypothetical protein
VGFHTIGRRSWLLRGQRVVVRKQQDCEWENFYSAGWLSNNARITKSRASR